MFDDETRCVDLPEGMVERVAARLPRTGWNDLAEYITYVFEAVC